MIHGQFSMFNSHCPLIIAHYELFIPQPQTCSSYIAPFPESTVGMVLSRIFKSSQRDHLSMYSRSIFTQS